MLHYQGSDYVLGRALPFDGSYRQLDSFDMILSGLRCGGMLHTPNGGAGSMLAYNRDTSGYSVSIDHANPGGAYGPAHLNILGTQRKPVTLTATNHGRSVEISTPYVVFTNSIAWIPVVEDHQFPWRCTPQEGLHGWPWVAPRWDRNTFGDTGDYDRWDELFTGNPYTAAAMPVGLACVIADDAVCWPYMLLISSRLRGCVPLVPGQSIYVKCSGWFTPKSVTSIFLNYLAARICSDVSEASNWRALLASNTHGTLGHSSVYSDLIEVRGDDYMSQPVTWTLPQHDFAVAACSPFGPNSGKTAWTSASYVCIVADLPGQLNALCCFSEITPHSLEQDELFTLPNGIRIELEVGQ